MLNWLINWLIDWFDWFIKSLYFPFKNIAFVIEFKIVLRYNNITKASFPGTVMNGIIETSPPDCFIQVPARSGRSALREPVIYTGSRFGKLPNREPVYITGSRKWLGRIPNRLTYLIVLMIPFITVPEINGSINQVTNERVNSSTNQLMSRIVNRLFSQWFHT